jgi:RNA exonuclease 1
LNREVQKGHGTSGGGHDSTEDARTCLDLVKQKCEKGPSWGTGDAANENLFKRLARAGVRYKNQGGTATVGGEDGAKITAAVDWGDPKKGAGAAANVVIGCKHDDDVVEGVIRAVKGDPDGKEVPGSGVDFVWARLRELEALKGWWNNNKQAAAEAAVADVTETLEDGVLQAEISLTVVDKIVPSPDGPANESEAEGSKPAESSIAEAASTLSSRIHKIYEALPPCTAFIIYSGSGDPREMSRLQQMQQTFKREFKVKKWDQLSVQWTDAEEQALKKACKEARQGLGFMTVK